MFRRQLEAIYQTAIWQKETTGSTGLHIMFPMTGRMSEWNKVRDIAENVRLHPHLCCEADSYHPALVEMIEKTVKAALAHGKWVGVCGNAAASPNLATLLVGLGVNELSVSPANVAAVKNIIRAMNYSKLQEKAKKALQLESSEAIMELYKTNDDLL